VNPRAVFVRRDGRLRAPWGIGVFAVATFAAGMLVAAVGYPLLSLTPIVALAREWRVPLDQLSSLLALLIATYVALRVGDRVQAVSWARVGLHRGALAWRGLVVALAAGVLAILVPTALLLAAGRLRLESQPQTETWGAAALVTLVVLAPAACVEELALRGYLFTALRDAVRAPGAIALSSIVFALLHLLNPGVTVLSLAMVALAGVLLASIRLVTDSLYAAMTAHLGWNFAQAAILHAPVSGLPLPVPGYRLVDAGPAWLTGGAWGPEGGLAAAAGMLLATFLLARRRPARPNAGRGNEVFGP
jgi:membrane protease YdiL (CAAX protease family)